MTILVRCLRSSGLFQASRELPLATIEAAMARVLHDLDLRVRYGDFVLVNHRRDCGLPGEAQAQQAIEAAHTLVYVARKEARYGRR